MGCSSEKLSFPPFQLGCQAAQNILFGLTCWVGYISQMY